MKLLIASNNAHKTREIREILGSCFEEILSMRDAGIEADVVEDGETFADNARKKAEEILALSGYEAVLADDSGLCVDALGGAPGVYSARFAGEGHDDAANNIKLMEVLRDVPAEKRTARFTSCICLARKGRPSLLAQGFAEGLIAFAPSGDNGFGYDPYFFYPPLGKTFAELSSEEKNRVSHRRAALDKMRMLLEAEQNA